MNKEIKVFRFDIKEADESGDVGFIEGYASTFGNIDQGDDVVDKGAFKKTIKDKKGVFPILLDHDPSKPIGWNIEASEDDHGLKVKGEIQLVTEAAKNRYKLAKRALELKTAMGMSIGYSPVKAEPDKDRPRVRRLKELKLWEYSLVTFPMNEAATATAVKNLEIKKLVDLIQSGNYDLNEIKKTLAEIESQAVAPENDPDLSQSLKKLLLTMKR